MLTSIPSSESSSFDNHSSNSSDKSESNSLYFVFCFCLNNSFVSMVISCSGNNSLSSNIFPLLFLNNSNDFIASVELNLF